MNTSRRLGFPGSALLAATLALASACATEGAPPSRADIQALIGDAACQTDAQCGTVGVGAKACGGPERYLAFSSLRTDPNALHATAAQQAAARQKEVEGKGMMSTCSVVTDPGAYCDAGVCRLRRGGGAGGAQVR